MYIEHTVSFIFPSTYQQLLKCVEMCTVFFETRCRPIYIYMYMWHYVLYPTFFPVVGTTAVNEAIFTQFDTCYTVAPL